VKATKSIRRNGQKGGFGQKNGLGCKTKGGRKGPCTIQNAGESRPGDIGGSAAKGRPKVQNKKKEEEVQEESLCKISGESNGKAKKRPMGVERRNSRITINWNEASRQA